VSAGDAVRSRRARRDRGKGALRIAMIGQRGLPATYGGIEHHVEEIGRRLVERGHQVTVFCRTNYVERAMADYHGITLRHLPTVGTKHLDAVMHSALSTVAAVPARFDIVHYHALGPGVMAPLPRYLTGAKVVQTIHGLDHLRAKWGSGSKAALRAAAWLSGHVPDATIVVARFLTDYYRETYGREAVYVPNGVDEPVWRPARQIVEQYELEPGSYLLFLGRLVPEKAPDVLIRAFRRLPGDQRLVIAGGSSFTTGFVDELHALAKADPRVLFTGYVYGELLDELYSNAAGFVLPSLLEGLPLTLLEAASYGTPVIASSIPPHLEVLGAEAPGRRLCPAGDEDALLAAVERNGADPEAERAGAKELRQHVLDAYRWEDAVDATESIYRDVLKSRKVARNSPTRVPNDVE
jgi:glycosyltransferase involved in cell wall biosynthesis